MTEWYIHTELNRDREEMSCVETVILRHWQNGIFTLSWTGTGKKCPVWKLSYCILTRMWTRTYCLPLFWSWSWLCSVWIAHERLCWPVLICSNGTTHVDESVEPTVPVSKAAAPAAVDSEAISEKSAEPEPKEDEPQQVKTNRSRWRICQWRIKSFLNLKTNNQNLILNHNLPVRTFIFLCRYRCVGGCARKNVPELKKRNWSNLFQHF